MKRHTRIVVTGLVLAASIAAALAAEPERKRAWMGVLLGDPRPARADVEGSPTGVPLIGIVEDGPAAEAGLRAQDVVIAVDGVRVLTTRELIERIGGREPDAWVGLTVARGASERDLRVRLATRPDLSRPQLSVRRGWIGIEAINLPETLGRHFGSPDGNGVMVSRILEGSPAEASGFELGDVIYEVSGQPVRSVAQLAQVIGRGGVGNEIELTVVRDGVDVVLESMVIAAPPAERRER